MDRNKALKAFEDYTGRYDCSDIKIQLKIDHTYRVADISARIAKSIDADEDFAWFLGLLHDIGRFEQQTRYGTFRDADSIDHADFGADLLFGEEALIKEFPDELDHIRTPEGSGWKSIAEAAVRNHNKLTVPDGTDEVTKMYSDILRDADKIDIFRVMTEPPYDVRNEQIKDMTTPAGEKVMNCVKEHRCVPRADIKNKFEAFLSQCCMGFELVYPESRVIAREQGYLPGLLELEIKEKKLKEQLETVRNEMKL